MVYGWVHLMQGFILSVRRRDSDYLAISTNLINTSQWIYPISCKLRPAIQDFFTY